MTCAQRTFYLFKSHLKYAMLCVLVAGICFHCTAQTASSYTADTLELVRKYEIASGEKRHDSAIKLFKETLQLALATNYKHLIYGSYLKIGEGYGYSGDWQQALFFMKQALPYSGDFNQTANYYDHIGWAYFSMGDYVNAAENFYAGLNELKNKTPSKQTEGGIYTDLGNVYLRLHQNEKAILYLRLGEVIARQNNYLNYLTNILVGKGLYFIDKHDIDSAKKCYEEEIIIGKRITRAEFEAEGYEGLGKVDMEMADYNKAIYHLRSALNVAANNDLSVTLETSYYLGDALYHTGRYKEAENMLVNTLHEAGKAHFRDGMLKGYTVLTNVYRADGQYQKAVGCMDSVSALKDALTSTEKAQAINLMEIRFETANKNRDIAKKQLLIARQERDLTHKNIWLISICGGATLLILLSIGIYRNTLQKQNLQTQKMQSLEQENKINILKAAVQGIDDERSRIARELHDGIGGMLGAAMMRFSVMHHENEDIGNITAYKEGMDILTEMGDEIRKTAHNLMPEVLLKQDLADALRSYCSSVEKTGTLDIDLQCYGSSAGLTQELKLNIYRIVQELLKNIMAHAHADYALVQLVINDAVLTITIEDNGTGFDTNSVKNGIGLHNLQTRVSSLDGHFTLESAPGKGTSVFIEFEL